MMIKWFLPLLLAVSFPDIDDIARINEYKAKAKEAYLNQNFEQAAEYYSFLVDSLEVEDPNILLNLAHSYYKSGNGEQALGHYRNLTYSDIPEIRSVAYQQLGVMSAAEKKYEPALQNFKEALKANPANEEARYNYELVKKLNEQQKEQQKQDKKDQDKNQDEKQEQQQQDQQEQQDQEQKDQEQQDQEQQQQEQQDQEQQQQEQQQQEEQEQQQQKQQQEQQQEQEQEQDQQQMKEERLEEINMSEEMAQMILEAMRNNEIQYYQQLRRKMKKKDSNKPDW